MAITDRKKKNYVLYLKSAEMAQPDDRVTHEIFNIGKPFKG